eukprot:CAMPEP_0180395806 /NCGR_PEP_ID=MMETSP0989-20121125/35090_1 /TAXON_ID=697907 /ORGANISM="non described non described, Strain CCMP2293" /LENGTH=101 /DNA_ID=CAMNT_0022398003 /DNA_START=80 /DNA_END=385 /DNA_ORIENTATION=-
MSSSGRDCASTRTAGPSSAGGAEPLWGPEVAGGAPTCFSTAARSCRIDASSSSSSKLISWAEPRRASSGRPQAMGSVSEPKSGIQVVTFGLRADAKAALCS